MAHGHVQGINSEEIHVMAESVFRNGVPLVRIAKSGRDGLNIWAVYKNKAPIRKAELNYTTDAGQWENRKWNTIAAVLDAKARKVSARLPKEATAYYFNLVDDRDLVVSSEHEEILPNKTKGGDVQ